MKILYFILFFYLNFVSVKDVCAFSNEKFSNNRNLSTSANLTTKIINSAIKNIYSIPLNNCSQNDETKRAILPYSFNKLYDILMNTNRPNGINHNLHDISEQCIKQNQLYLDGLLNLELWALKVFDSSAKVPSGILNGNVNQFGDFDQCLSVKKEFANEQIRGKYCLLNLQIEKPQQKILAKLHKLFYSNYPFTSTLYDPGHRLPRLTTINWALCVPSGCSAKEIKTIIDFKIHSAFQELNFEVETRLEEEMCQVKRSIKDSISKSTVVTIIFFLFVFILTTFATIYDYITLEPKSEILTSFSLIKNFKALLSTKRSREDIKSLHGIRFTNALMLIFAHKSMALFFNPYINRTEMSEILGKNWTVLARGASLYTDPFIMMSGTLIAYSVFGRLHRNQRINLLNEYLSRLFRLIPTLSALILFTTHIMPLLGSGPQWNLVVTTHANICKKTWWRNLLFIHNYYGFENMCLTHTHHVGIDTQLFAVFPIFIWILWKWRNVGALFLTFLATISTLLRFCVTIKLNLSNYVHYGTSISQLFATADNMYTLPVHRATVYIMGILLGYYLREYPNVVLKPLQLKIGNMFTSVLFIMSFFGAAYMGGINYKYNAWDAAWYAAFAPIGWCLSFIWIIYTSHMGYENFITQIFSWKGFLIATRLSYAVYLTQFPIFFYNVGIKRNPEYYSILGMNINIVEIVAIYVISMILTLLFDSPFQNLRKCLFSSKTTENIDSTKNKDN